jgi:hypothetical protein
MPRPRNRRASVKALPSARPVASRKVTGRLPRQASLALTPDAPFFDPDLADRQVGHLTRATGCRGRWGIASRVGPLQAGLVTG